MEWNPRPVDAHSVTVHRRGQGEPLVLLHCLGMSWRFWDVLEPLTDRFELIAYSFPGHHDSPLPDHQYGVPELTAQLRGIAEREGLHKFHLMGISLGGSVAQHFAGTYPHMVDRLVLADCTPRYDDESRANWPLRGAAARKDGVASLIPMLLKVWFSPKTLAEEGPNVRFVRETLAACSGEGYALACEALAMLDAREQAKRIIAQTLILVGSEERQSFQDAARWMQANIRGSRLTTVPDAGHASVRDQPDFVIGALRDFLGAKG
jgi:pimeloyl-ACP methyl ester carboxylesterase